MVITMRTNRPAALLPMLLPMLLLGACEVNQMPMYAASIMTVQMEATVTGDIEITVNEPTVISLDGHPVSVIDPSQDALIGRFVDRIGTRIVESELGTTSVGVFQSEAVTALGWNLTAIGSPHDAAFTIDVNDIEITIDDWGWPLMKANVKVEGWFVGTGELIYREYTDHEVPMLYLDELVEPWDPSNFEDLMGARAINLATLASMPDHELRARVYTAIEEVSAVAAAELVRATRGY
jgi:hypothetical protein